MREEQSRRRRRSRLGFCLPGYKWCGPGCSGPGAPVNAVDACCKAHDECYRSGRDRCYCDQQFLRCLRNYINYSTREGREAALIYHYMKLVTAFNCFGSFEK